MPRIPNEVITIMTVPTSESKPCDQIRRLNDFLRSSVGVGARVAIGLGGKVDITHGVDSLPETAKAAIFEKVREFNDFTQEDDLLGEHDFGVFQHEGQEIVWQISYYDPTETYHSEDPASSEKTVRVLTIMLAEDL
jgi:hypothetical protein